MKLLQSKHKYIIYVFLWQQHVANITIPLLSIFTQHYILWLFSTVPPVEASLIIKMRAPTPVLCVGPCCSGTVTIIHCTIKATGERYLNNEMNKRFHIFVFPVARTLNLTLGRVSGTSLKHAFIFTMFVNVYEWWYLLIIHLVFIYLFLFIYIYKYIFSYIYFFIHTWYLHIYLFIYVYL